MIHPITTGCDTITMACCRLLVHRLGAEEAPRGSLRRLMGDDLLVQEGDQAEGDPGLGFGVGFASEP